MTLNRSSVYYMVLSRFILMSFVLTILTCIPIIGSANNKLKAILDTEGPEIARRSMIASAGNTVAAYKRFVGAVAKFLASQGEVELSEEISKGVAALPYMGVPLTEFAWITHVFAREVYKDSVIKYTAELVRFRTFATDVPNRNNPEFVRQKEFLRTLAYRLELRFNDVDGFMQEIWIGGGEESFGIISHSDVQPVDSGGWIRDPWSGAVIDGTIWGRGAIDDKGPIVAVMYGMRALLDSGLPLKKKIILLVGTDEESANEDLDTYLKSHKPPDQTIVVDSNYPVICAEKGWCGMWLELPRENTPPVGDGPRIVYLNSGLSASIIPDKAVAKVLVAGAKSPHSPKTFKSLLETKSRSFMKSTKGSRLSVEQVGDTIVVSAFGKSVHSSIPHEGHNALMDLLVFLDRDVRPLRNEYALLARFAARNIGFETDGRSLGIAHHDDFMGDVTVAADLFQTTDTTVMFMFNFRLPRGIDSSRIAHTLHKRYDEFNKEYNITLKTTEYMSNALYTDPASPFVRKLLGIYNSVTGENRKAQSIGGGTYAKRLPHAVVFGPSLPDEEYLGHQHNENIKISTLLKNIELLTHAMVEFGM